MVYYAASVAHVYILQFVLHAHRHRDRRVCMHAGRGEGYLEAMYVGSLWENLILKLRDNDLSICGLSILTHTHTHIQTHYYICT